MAVAAVTGGSGRLGNVLVRTILESGRFRPRVLVHPAEASPRSLAGLDVELLRGDVRDAAAAAALVDGAEVVFHLAARIDLGPDRDRAVWSINFEGTRAVAEACRARGTRLVHCSSHHALERRPLAEPLDEDRPLALAEPCPYHRAKAHAERLVRSLLRQGLDAVVVSPGSMIGPHDYEPSMMGQAMLDLYHGRLPLLVDAVSDYVDARDVAAAVVAAAERGRRGERYLLTGEVLDMRRYGALVAEATGRPVPRVCLPLWAGWALLPAATIHARLAGTGTALTPGMLRAAVSNDVVSHERAARELGFAPRPVGEAIRGSFEWFDEMGWLGAGGARA